MSAAPVWFRAAARLVGRERMARWFNATGNAPRLGQMARMFDSARASRLTDGWMAYTSSADAESISSLTALRNRSRALIRDNPHAKRAQAIVVNNVIGTGVGLQASVTNNRGRLVSEINDAIEAAWAEWSRPENCHIGGRLHFADIERLLLSEAFEAGDVLIRIHREGRGAVPLSLEVIEAERLADEWEAPSTSSGNLVRQGVECDEFNRPVAYWIHEFHPGDPRRERLSDRLIRVRAEDIIHLAKIDRWPQVRGVPWMHAAMKRLHQLGEFTEAALVAARLGAEKVMILKENEDGRLAEVLGEEANDGNLSWNSAKGQVDILPSGTDLVDWSPQYPDAAIEPFVVHALRDLAAAFGVSYESLSRDYSRSNYSSSRLALLDDRDGWRVLQQWYIRSVRERLHRVWLEAAVLSRALPAIGLADYLARPTYFQAVAFKPRGWSWVDPTKEVNAYKEAVKAGFLTVGDVIAATGGGRDLEDVLKDRRHELDMMAESDLQFDTDPAFDQATPAPAPAAAPQDSNPEDAAPPARVFAMKRDLP